jgi:pSer/pThr/pTyr-binding forkhead associated (FHA) protein
MAKNVVQYKNFEAPKEEGVYYRLLCLNGRGKGVSYFLMGKRIVIGRADTVDIQVFDIKSSREHAEITKVGKDVIVTDLGSQNGVVVNDLKVRQHRLKDGDKLIIGQTVFKFGRIKVAGSRKKEVKKVDTDEEEVEEEVKKKKNPIVLIILALGGIYMFLSDSGDEGYSRNGRMKNKSLFKTKMLTDDFSNAVEKKKLAIDKETAEKMKLIFQQGLREYRGGNYFRAMNEFKKALIVKPDDAQANYYLRKAKDALDDLIKQHFNKGIKEFDALKFNSAKVEYCSIRRILYNYPDHEDFKKAGCKLREIEKSLGMDKCEIECIESRSVNQKEEKRRKCIREIAENDSCSKNK